MAPHIYKSVLEKIEEEKIVPRPVWHFLFRNALFWLTFGVSALIGGRAIGVIIRVFSETDFSFIMQARGSMIRPLLALAPLLWIIFFLLLLLSSAYGLHYTRKGYKISTLKLIGINLVISIIIGSGSFILGDADRFEQAMHKRAPFFGQVENRREKAWSSPEEGRLAGQVISITDDRILLLDDFLDRRWTVEYGESEQWFDFELREKMKLRIVGSMISENVFKAEIIGPWKGRRKPRFFR